MPSEMVERVARALYERNPYYESGEALDGFGSRYVPLSWDQCCERRPGYAQGIRWDVRAALREVRVPTAAMIRAMVEARDPNASVAAIWAAGIDAALSDEEGGDAGPE